MPLLLSDPKPQIKINICKTIDIDAFELVELAMTFSQIVETAVLHNLASNMIGILC